MGAAASTMNNDGRKSWGGFEDIRVDAVGIGTGDRNNGPGGRFRDELATESERTYTTFQHLIGLVSALDGMGFLGLIGSIIMWRIKANESPFYDDHGREAVNFQISLLVYAIGGAIILGLFTAITLGVGIVLAAPIGAVGVLFLIVIRIVGCIRGSIAANRGEYYRYPVCLRFLA
jgi:hypothetical protein